MSQKFYNDPKFIKLNAKWRKKLEKAGFDDIENENENIDRGSWDFHTAKSKASQQTKTEYYYLATQFLNDHPFETILDKTVWTYHTEALGVRDIAKLLKKLGILNKFQTHSLKHASVFNIVKRLKKLMYERYR